MSLTNVTSTNLNWTICKWPHWWQMDVELAQVPFNTEFRIYILRLKIKWILNKYCALVNRLLSIELWVSNSQTTFCVFWDSVNGQIYYRKQQRDYLLTQKGVTNIERGKRINFAVGLEFRGISVNSWKRSCHNN